MLDTWESGWISEVTVFSFSTTFSSSVLYCKKVSLSLSPLSLSLPFRVCLLLFCITSSLTKRYKHMVCGGGSHACNLIPISPVNLYLVYESNTEKQHRVFPCFNGMLNCLWPSCISQLQWTLPVQHALNAVSYFSSSKLKPCHAVASHWYA